MKKSYLFYVLVISISLLFIWRLAFLQLFTDKYILNAFNTSIKREVTFPKRGDILDRNGKLLVTNNYDYEIHLTPLLMENNFDTLRFCELLGINRYVFDLRMAEIDSTKSFNKVASYPFLTGLNRDDFTRFQEQLYKFPAVDIVKRPKRTYLVQSAGNVLGYINEVNPREIKKDSTYYQLGDLVGKSGVEKSYEAVLRGEKGFKYIKKDIHFNTIGSYENGKNDIQVKNGKSITLSLDYDLQYYAEQLLVNKRGAVVAIEPKTGEILALASSPYIDPRRYNQPGELYRMNNDSVNKIMYDRASQAMYPPGSPFKLMMGLAAFQMGVTDTATTFVCHHGFRYGNRRMGCHCGTYYPIRIGTAIQQSCNSYFSNTWMKILGKDSTNIETGINEWKAIMASFGLGNYLNNDLAVGSAGNIPGSDYYNNIYGKGGWNKYSIVSNAIGQGEILLTPLQMANFVAAIANKGYFYTPHIVKEIDGQPIQDSTLTTPRHTLVDPKWFPFMIDGMERVIKRGTGRRIYTKYFTQAGKTGTAENSQGQDHSLFTLMAPVEDPQIVVAVIVENGHYGATWAAPISSLVAEKYITDTIRRKSLEKRMLKGNFKSEYRRQEINRLKRNGWWVEPKIDSNARDTLL